MISSKRFATMLCLLSGVGAVIAPAAGQARRPVRRPFLHQPMAKSEMVNHPVTLPPTPGFYTPLVGGTWSPIGPAPLDELNDYGIQSGMSGRVATIAASPTDSNTYYVGPAGGGVWKTTDGGTSWTPLTDAQPTLTMGAITIAPSNANVVYAGMGEANFSGDSFYGDGILVSTDAGATWTLRLGPSNAFLGATTSKIVVDPGNPNSVYAAMATGIDGTAGHTGVYHSTDGGATWSNTTSTIDLTDPYTDLVMNPSNSSILYCAIGNTFGSVANGVYETTNGGTSWSRLANHPNGGTNSNVGRIAIALAASAPNTLYTTIQNTSPFGAVLGVFKTTDGGTTWSQLGSAPDTANPQADYDMPIAVSPTNANVVFLAGAGQFSGENVAESTDGGATWNNVQDDAAGNGPHTDEHSLVFDSAGRMLNGCDGGIWRLDNLTPGSLHWESINSNLATIQFTGGDLHPTNPLYAIGGSQDNGTEIFNNNLTWPMVDGEDGGFCKIDYTTPLTMYHTYAYETLERSDDGGSTWNPITPSQENSDFYPHFTMDLLNSQTILFPTTGVWRTADKGANWTEVGSPAVSGFNAAFSNVNCIGAAGATIYASAGGAVFVTTNTGGAWTQVNVPGFSDHFEDIAVNPTNPAQAYIVRDLFTGSAGTGHVFFTNNTGATWTDLTGNMPDLPTNAVKVDWSTSTVWVGTDAGVYMSTVPSQWSLFGSGLPNARVVDLALNTSYGELAAFTHGRSAWTIQLPEPAPVLTTISPSSATVGSTGLTLTVNGTGFVSGTVVSWGAASLVTTFVSSTQVTAAVPTADLASAGTVVVTAANPSSGPSNGLTFTINNPVPTLTSISPAVGAAGSGPTTITLTGTNFVSTSVAQWAGSPLSTTFGSATSISASVPSSDLTTTGSFAVTVVNATPGGGTSGSQSFVVDTPIILSSLSPASATAGNYQLSIQVLGTGFTSDCKVYWKGSLLTTTFVSSTKLTALVPAADMNTPGPAAITVQNSLGLVSNNSLTFTVGQPYPVHLVSLRITPTSVVGGTVATGVIMLSGIAPSGGYAVRITSSRPGLTFTPLYVYVHTGVSTASFSIGTAVPPSTQVARITATLGPIARAAYLTVTP